MFAEEEDHEGEYKRQANDQSQRNDGHDSVRLVFLMNGGECRSLDLDGPAAGRGIAAMAVAEHLPGGQPVFEIATFRTAVFDPKQVRCVLDFGFTGIARNRSFFALHGNVRMWLKCRTESVSPLRKVWRALRISCETAQADASD